MNRLTLGRPVAVLFGLLVISGSATGQERASDEFSGGTALAGPVAESEAHGRALELINTGQRAEALHYLRFVDAGAPVRTPSLILLYGTLAREAGDLAEAIEVFRRGLAHAGPTEEAVIRTELAVTRSWTGDLNGAEDGYRAALAADQGFRPARAGLARVLRWKGKNDEAEALYRDLLADGGSPVEAMVGMGFLSLAALEGSEARHWFDRALELDPDNAEARDGLGRLHDARRVTVQWTVTRAQRGTTETEALQWAGSASYRVTPHGTVTGSLDLAPRVENLASNPNASTPSALRWTAALGWSERISHTWSAALRVEAVSATVGTGYLATAEGGRRFGTAWTATAGVRGGTLPGIGSDVMGWASLTRVGGGRKAASATFFYGTDLQGSWSRSVLLSASVGLGERVTARAGVARGWTRTLGFREVTVSGRLGLGGGREILAELFRFDGAFERSGLRLGAKLGF